MNSVINAKELRMHLGKVVATVRRGARYTVLYRSRPAFDLVPVGNLADAKADLSEDSLYHAEPVGSSDSGDAARRHDAVIYS